MFNKVLIKKNIHAKYCEKTLVCWNEIAPLYSTLIIPLNNNTAKVSSL